jgi:hypothetical protein
MPLSWNIGKIEMYKDDTDKAYIEREEFGQKVYDLVPVTKAFIFWSGATGYGSITKSNAAEYYARSKAVEKICNTSFLTGWGEDENGDSYVKDIYIEMQNVKDHIGLATNHNTFSTKLWLDIFMRNNKSVAPGRKIVQAMITLYKYEYEQWDKSEILIKEEVNA